MNVNGTANNWPAKEFFMEISTELALPAEARHGLMQAVSAVENNPDLKHTLLSLQELYLDPVAVPDWKVVGIPAEVKECSVQDYSLNLLFALACTPACRAKAAATGLPGPIIEAGLQDIGIWVCHSLRTEGKSGLPWGILEWLRFHLNLKLFQLGRLQYIEKEFSYAVKVYRHRQTQQVQVLAADGINVSPDGLIRVDGQRIAFCTTLRRTPQETFGYPVTPAGRILGKPVILTDAEWECVMGAGDPVLDVHIPEGGNFTPQVCRESLQQAIDFFTDYRSYSFKGFICSTWLFDPSFPQILKPASNILAFMKEFYCVPLATNHSEALWRVFGSHEIDRDTVSAKNSMQRAMLAHLDARGTFREAGGLLLKHDAQTYGQQQYWWPSLEQRIPAEDTDTINMKQTCVVG